MSGKMVKISLDEAREYKDKDIMEFIKRKPVYGVRGIVQNEKNDELVDLEIALRQCERVGFFRNE